MFSIASICSQEKNAIWGYSKRKSSIRHRPACPTSAGDCSLDRVSWSRSARRPIRREGTVIHGPPTGLFSLRSAELFQGFLMQDLNLRQVFLRFFDMAPDRVQLLLDRDLASLV
jgi:hypothetical protein